MRLSFAWRYERNVNCEISERKYKFTLAIACGNTYIQLNYKIYVFFVKHNLLPLRGSRNPYLGNVHIDIIYLTMATFYSQDQRPSPSVDV